MSTLFQVLTVVPLRRNTYTDFQYLRVIVADASLKRNVFYTLGLPVLINYSGTGLPSIRI